MSRAGNRLGTFWVTSRFSTRLRDSSTLTEVADVFLLFQSLGMWHIDRGFRCPHGASICVAARLRRLLTDARRT